MVRIRKHPTRWEGPEEEVDAARLEASNSIRNQIGREIFSLEVDMIRSYRAWEEGTTGEGATETPLAAAPPEEEQGLESLQAISLHMSYNGADFDFDGYIANQNGRDIVVFFTDIRGEEARAGQTTVQFVILEHHLFSSPFTVQFLKEHLGERFFLWTIPTYEPLDLSALGRALQVQPVEG